MNEHQIKYAMLAVLGLILGLVLGITFYLGQSVQKPHIATVDITSIINGFIRTEAEQDITREELMARTKIFATGLENSLHKYADKKHLVIMPTEAVIAGGNDITYIIKEQIEQAMQQVYLEQEKLEKKHNEKIAEAKETEETSKENKINEVSTVTE